MHQLSGVLLCMAGGIGIGVFLLPLKYSKNWAWENSWLLGSLFMYLILPVTEALIFVPRFLDVFRAANPHDTWMIENFLEFGGCHAALPTRQVCLPSKKDWVQRSGVEWGRRTDFHPVSYTHLTLPTNREV